MPQMINSQLLDSKVFNTVSNLFKNFIKLPEGALYKDKI
jgi:hypothetical protein